MKNAINYYYNLEISDIHQNEGNFKFTANGNHYILFLLKQSYNLEELYDITLNLYQRRIYSHMMILNKDQNLVTMVNEKPYLLLWYFEEMNQNVTLNDILYFSNQDYSFLENKHTDWGKLWADKIDYFEYQISDFKQKYPLLRKSINYFIGIAETGISLFNNSKQEYNNLVISHNRIYPDNTRFDLYNPLNYVVDIKVRDSAEYFKAMFLTEKNLMDRIKNYILTAQLDSYELQMFYVRFFYPSFYFDIYEKIVNGDTDEEEILTAMKKANEYETLLKELYRYISQYIILPDIEWIKKT